MMINDILTLSIASLRFVIDTRGSDLQVTAPPVFNQFLVGYDLRETGQFAVPGEMLLEVRHEEKILDRVFSKPICRTKLWELWLDGNDDFVFVSPRQSPPKLVYVDKDFQKGVIAFDFSSTKDKAIYPLASIDIRILINWLANCGDLVLHAAGAAVDGEGYCFIGPSGVGKSTLAADLIKQGEVTLLGEDQVVLRRIAGKFWVFGTPWHEYEDRCSPVGVPLKKVFFLDRRRSPGISLCPPADGVTQILQTAFVPYYLPEKIPVIIDQLSLLSEQVPFYRLSHEQGTLVLPKIVKQVM